MSAALPEVLDTWRAVSSRRRFDGVVPLAQFERLAGALADAEGQASYTLEFARDAAGTAEVVIEVRAQLPLTCQRTLRRFLHPVVVQQRLGLIAHERDEAALPPDYEVLLVADGNLRPFDLIEDELILALPVVALDPATAGSSEVVWSSDPNAAAQAATDARRNPFAALAKLKK